MSTHDGQTSESSEQPGIPQPTVAMSEEEMLTPTESEESYYDTDSEHPSSQASDDSDPRYVCPNCGNDHPLKHCPYPNTSDGRLQACFECDNTDHPWFKCSRYGNVDEGREFYLVYVSRQGLCPLVHNKQLHDLWRNYFPQLDDNIQALTLRRPGPLTTRFVRRMLEDGVNDPEIGRQTRYEHRSLPWHLSPDVLDCYELRVKSAVLDPDTRLMSHKVVYTHMKTGRKQKIDFVGRQYFGGTVDEVSLLDRHNLQSLPELHRQLEPLNCPRLCPPDCCTSGTEFCMRVDCDYLQKHTEHCMRCGMEKVPSIETLFNLPREIGATLERYGLLSQLSDHWHEIIHAQWAREDMTVMEPDCFVGVLRCVHHPEIYQTAENLQPIRMNTLRRVAEQLESNPNNNDVTSFDVLGLPECPECFAIETLGLGDYVQRIAPLRQDEDPRDDSES